MSTQTGPSTENAMVLNPRAQQLQTIRDGMEPGARPAAIIPRNFLEAQAMCAALAAANLVPKAFKGNPPDMLLVVMTGLEVGLPPMAALRLYTTWDGVPRLMAEGVRAVILNSPEIEYFEPQSCSETQATWIGKRRGRPEKSATWTIERAKRANLTAKDTWQKYPEDMLNARASMQLGRMIAPDVVAGMVSLEEARDGDFIEASFTEQKAGFVAPPLVAKAAADTPELRAAIAQVQAQPQAQVIQDPPKRGPGRPPKADPTPPQPSNAGASASAATASGGSAPPSTASTESQPSKLDAAIAEARIAAGVRGGPTASPDVAPERPTPPDSNTGPTPSAESGAASTAAKTSGVVDAEVPPPADDGFGDDPADSQPAKPKMADFYAWLAGCKTQRELQAGLQDWRTWSQDQAKAGDATFSKSGDNTKAMQDAYGKRKGEVPA